MARREDVEDVIWAAGFFDGEGCISIQRQRRHGNVYFYMSVSAYQNDIRPLNEFVELFGGTVCPEAAGHKWRAQGHVAAAALSEMVPHLRVKKEQAITAIEFQGRRLAVGAKRPADFSIDADEEDYMRCKQLKKMVV